MPKIEATQCASRQERLGTAAVAGKAEAPQSTRDESSGQKTAATPSN